MPTITRTPYDMAGRFIGVKEVVGHVHNPMIVAMMQLTDRSVRDDETPWCSGFVAYCAWLLEVPHSKSLRARSWLTVGQAITLEDARPGFDVVVLSRGADAPPADVISAPGHVGFFHAYDADKRIVYLLGGNQGNQVSIAGFPRWRVLGVRRLV
jgi:uncharacterized protein (TIGR02594 family)